MAREKLSIFPVPADLQSVDFFIGVRDNGDGTFTNYKYTYAQVAALASGAPSIRITVDTDGDTLTNSFFADNNISAIATQGQYYLSEAFFTQSGDTITGVGISFSVGQILIAYV